jgi:hypothetical protein
MQRDPSREPQDPSGRHVSSENVLATLVSALIPAAFTGSAAYAFSPFLFDLIPDFPAALNSVLGLQLAEGMYQRVFAGLVALLVVIGRIFSARTNNQDLAQRNELFMHLAARQGGRMETANTGKVLADELHNFYAEGGWVSTEHVMWIESPDARIAIADIHYRPPMGTSGGRQARTIAYLQSKGLRYPAFSLHPETRMTNVVIAIGGITDIDFPAHPDFSARYHLSADREEDVRLLFDAPLLAKLGSYANLNIRSHDGNIALHRDNVIVADEALPHFTDTALKILDAFQQAAGRARLTGSPSFER